jgi:hypothetical protein
MNKKTDTLEHDKGQKQVERRTSREDAVEALRRLRSIGEKLPAVDAAALIREGRDLTEQGSR